MKCHVSSIGDPEEPEQQSPSDVQCLPSAISVFHPSGVPKLVQPDVAHLVGKTEIVWKIVKAQ